MKRLLSILILFCVPAFGTTYYVSSSTGADTNTSTQAQSKSTPWKNLKWMRSATSNAASYSVVAGDSFILMGCDVWPNASFPLTGTITGTSGAHVTIGVDQTWYNATNCPSSWNRPKFDAGSAIINPPECTNNNDFWEFGTSAYVDVNWIELVNYFWTSNQAGGSCYSHEFWVSSSSSASRVTLNNFYVHAWTVQNGADDIDHGFFTGCPTCSVNYMVADNSDGTIHTGIGMQWQTLYSVITKVSNALKPNNAGEYGYNNISHVAATGSPIISTSVHPNCIETIGATGAGIYYIHDNLVHDGDTGTSGGAGGCEGLQVGNPGETDYVWNNLWYNNTVTGANGPDLPQNSSTGVVGLWYVNNTNVDQRSVCVANGGNTTNWTSFFIMENNHCITTGTPTGTSQSQGMMSGGTITGATTITFGNNVVMSATTATSDGYTNSQTFVYSPISGSSPTVGAGTNLTATFPAGFITNDTTYACTESTVGGVVESVCPARTTNSRPSSGAWDSGAYEFSSGGQATTPSCIPGTGTYTGTQTVTCTNPNSGTTVMCYSTSTTPVTNGAGTGCTTGTQYTTTISVASSETLNVVAGTSTLTDSSVVSYVYTITTSNGSNMMTQGVIMTQGAIVTH